LYVEEDIFYFFRIDLVHFFLFIVILVVGSAVYLVERYDITHTRTTAPSTIACGTTPLLESCKTYSIP
jgi:hypothetical protein